MKKSCVDHLGNEYPSITEMCCKWGISLQTYVSRINAGWTVEKALTALPSRIAVSIPVEYQGKKYPSIKNFAAAMSIPRSSLSFNLQKMGTIGEAVEKTVEGRGIVGTAKTCTDHTGQTFSSIKKMLDYWGCDGQRYYYGIKHGWDLKKILERKAVKDHKGNVYSNFSQMCKAYDKKPSIVKRRLDANWPLNEALLVSVHKKGEAVFPSVKRMQIRMRKQWEDTK